MAQGFLAQAVPRQFHSWFHSPLSTQETCVLCRAHSRCHTNTLFMYLHIMSFAVRQDNPYHHTSFHFDAHHSWISREMSHVPPPPPPPPPLVHFNFPCRSSRRLGLSTSSSKRTLPGSMPTTWLCLTRSRYCQTYSLKIKANSQAVRIGSV